MATGEGRAAGVAGGFADPFPSQLIPRATQSDGTQPLTVNSFADLVVGEPPGAPRRAAV